MKNHVLYFTNPNQVEAKAQPIPNLKTDEVLIQNYYSAISAGTEMLFYRGLMPNGMLLDKTLPTLQNEIKYPFKYGYSSVGKVIEVSTPRLKYLLNHWVFVFNPHESFFCAHEDQIILLPEDISPRDAIFLSNMETAVNLILDGAPLIGENVIVLGLGMVGLLTTTLLKQYPLAQLMGADFFEKRCNLALEMGATKTFAASTANLQFELKHYLASLSYGDVDLIYELTGNQEGLNTAIDFAAYEGRIVLGSWYGKKTGHIDLGGKFHRNRIKLIPSQVSTIASELQGRWTKQRRFDLAFEMLRKIRPARYISHQFHITDANKAYQLLEKCPGELLQVILTYG